MSQCGHLVFDVGRARDLNAGMGFGFIAHQHEPDYPVFQPRHGRRQKTGGKEDIGLQRAVCQEIELFLQFIAGARGIDRQVDTSNYRAFWD